MKKILIISFCVLVLIAVSVYTWLKYDVLRAKDFKPEVSKQKNAIDLRPSLIAKLQQMVKDGSDGLYVLSIDKINADVLGSKLDIIDGRIGIDTQAMHQLDLAKNLPDDIFKIKFSTLHIDGIGIEDLLNKKSIDIKGIYFTNPLIEVFHKRRAYNKEQRNTNDSLSLYQKLKGQANSINIANIKMEHGTFINYDMANKNGVTKLNDIFVDLKDLRIDSSTQFDKDRFLFSKHAAIDFKNYVYRTPDSLYFFRVGDIHVSGDQHKVIANDVELKPRGNKRQFESKLSARKEMYHIKLPSVILNDVSWWAMINHEKFVARQGEINAGEFNIYLDRTLPPNNSIKQDNFPHQVLMRLPFPFSVAKLNLNNINVIYEEFNPAIKRSATVYFDNVRGVATNITNVAAEIKRSRFINFSGRGSFMHRHPIYAKFKLDLLKYKTGNFSVDVHMDTLNNTTVNPITETLSQFSVKRGQMQKATAHISGNNFTTKVNIAFLYSDLHITPLKTDSNAQGKLKKKTFTSFFANTFLIKNSNPRNGDLRQPEFTVDRTKHGNFFNFIWVSLLTGILKTIGIPPKFIVK